MKIYSNKHLNIIIIIKSYHFPKLFIGYIKST